MSPIDSKGDRLVIVPIESKISEQPDSNVNQADNQPTALAIWNFPTVSGADVPDESVHWSTYRNENENANSSSVDYNADVSMWPDQKSEYDHTTRLNGHATVCTCDICNNRSEYAPIGYYECTCTRCDPEYVHLSWAHRTNRHAILCSCLDSNNCSQYVHSSSVGHWDQCNCNGCYYQIQSSDWDENCSCPLCDIQAYIDLRHEQYIQD